MYVCMYIDLGNRKFMGYWQVNTINVQNYLKESEHYKIKALKRERGQDVS